MLALLSSYKERRQEFSNPKTRNKDVWQIISEDMEWKGFTGISGKDCETKFKNLKRAYVNTVDHNNTTGNAHKSVLIMMNCTTCLTRMQQLLQLLCAVITEARLTNNQLLTQQQMLRRCTRMKKSRKRRKRYKHLVAELVSLFREFTKSIEENEKQKMSKLEEMYTEKMNVMGRFLQVFEKYAEKE